MSDTTSSGQIRVGTLDELKARGCIVVRGAQHPIAVFHDNGQVYAVDNRCPHMGFPLSRGSVADGILTCHWHHARFELSSGCTFDLFADDVPPAEVEVRKGEVWVAERCRPATVEDLFRRLREGMAQNIGLVIAKSIIALLRQGADPAQIVREGALFGARHRDGWSMGMQILAAMANLVPHLPEEERFLALYHGLTRVARDCAGQTPRRDRYPLEDSRTPVPTLGRWLRQWTRVRHRDGAERTLLTGIARGMSPAELTQMLLTAVTDRAYADAGHLLDFVNKSFELLDIVGEAHRTAILPAVVRQLATARGGEEQSAWHHPNDLIRMLSEAFEQLPTWLNEGRGRQFSDELALAERLRSDQPGEVLDALREAIRAGGRALQLTRALSYAAAMRVARFGTSNEFGDWITALHTFTYCNALHQSFRRIEAAGAEVTPELMRGVFHGAVSVYLDRFLNIPPAALPGERNEPAERLDDASALRERYLELLDRQQSVSAAARVVARYLELGHPVEPLIGTLARGVLREDADFHTFQMLEAAVQQHAEWGPGEPGRNILIALARYAAAHSPTQRADLQTAEIALRLDRGGALHEE